jgi:beta-glucosidase-like glycosyl hydrolase
MVRGFQDQVPGGAGTLAACAKHFVGYGLVGGGRDYETVQVGENTLRNCHLRPFREAVRAGCATVMAAFTDVDGIPMDAHRRLLREELTDEWGFDHPYIAVNASAPKPGPESRLLAREAAAASLVLVANDGILPLAPHPSHVPLTGPFVREGEALLAPGPWMAEARTSPASRRHSGPAG